jgi:hypothetical protein
MENPHLVMRMCRPMRVAHICLQYIELAARNRDGLHTREAQGAEVRVDRVERLAFRVGLYRGGYKLLGDFLKKNWLVT